MFRKTILLLLVVLAGCTKPIEYSAPEDYGGLPDELILLEMHNGERFKRGLCDLQIEAKLDLAAQKHADWMAANHKMSHTGAGRSSVGDRVGGGWQTWGENIAYGAGTERQVQQMWMNSSGHRANILNRSFNDVGIGIAATEDGVIYWCVDFGLKN
jgi:uncharacterized protein YkwD